MGRTSLGIKIRKGQGRRRVPARFVPIGGGHRARGAKERICEMITRKTEGVGRGKIAVGGGVYAMSVLRRLTWGDARGFSTYGLSRAAHPLR